MTDPLRSEILVPVSPYTRRTLLFAAGCGALGAAIGLAALPRSSSQAITFVPAAPAQIEVVQAPTPPVVAHESVQPLRASELSLVFTAGGATYMKLADISETAEILPKHGKAKLYSDDYIETAVASVSVTDVPRAYRSWLDRHVNIDNTCATKVIGFAVVSRLTGDTGYSGVDDGKWTATNVLDQGSVVLAAKLTGCKGTFARAAELPAVIVPQEINDKRLAKQALAALIASTPARETQLDYVEVDQHGNWWDAEYAQFSTKIVRHPTTGVTWVSVHGHMDHGCGDPEVNVWGLFRVEDDGTLAAVQLRKLGDLWSIDQLIDIDNDGELEVIGKPWLGLDTVVARGSGEELDRLSLSFFGCPC
jgi:hypothetical protein